jgi:hypothetical protein
VLLYHRPHCPIENEDLLFNYIFNFLFQLELY